MGATVPLVRGHAFLAEVPLARVAVVIALAAAIRQVGPPAAAASVTGSHGAVVLPLAGYHLNPQEQREWSGDK